MAMSLNRAQIIGNLTRDPEVRQTPGGQSVASFGVATNFSWTDQSGQRQEKVEFHNVVAWRKLADICGQYLRKGSKVFIEGRLQTRDWEGEDGVRRYRTEIIADNMIMLDRKGEGVSGGMSSGLNAVPVEESDSSSGGADQDREAAGLDDDSSDKNASKKASADNEEEVAIDDLPF